jgi:hypothetical protein
MLSSRLSFSFYTFVGENTVSESDPVDSMTILAFLVGRGFAALSRRRSGDLWLALLEGAELGWDCEPSTAISFPSGRFRCLGLLEAAELGWDSEPPTGLSFPSGCFRFLALLEAAELGWVSEPSTGLSFPSGRFRCLELLEAAELG